MSKFGSEGEWRKAPMQGQGTGYGNAKAGRSGLVSTFGRAMHSTTFEFQ